MYLFIYPKNCSQVQTITAYKSCLNVTDVHFFSFMGLNVTRHVISTCLQGHLVTGHHIPTEKINQWILYLRFYCVSFLCITPSRHCNLASNARVVILTLNCIHNNSFKGSALVLEHEGTTVEGDREAHCQTHDRFLLRHVLQCNNCNCCTIVPGLMSITQCRVIILFALIQRTYAGWCNWLIYSRYSYLLHYNYCEWCMKVWMYHIAGWS